MNHTGVVVGHGLAPSSGIYPRELNPADLSLISGPKTVPLLLTSDTHTSNNTLKAVPSRNVNPASMASRCISTLSRAAFFNNKMAIRTDR